VSDTPEQLLVQTAHRPDCTFGPGFFRLEYADQRRFCQDQDEAMRAVGLIREFFDGELRLSRDAYCLDGDQPIGDANTPDVVDAEWWLGLNVADGMRELGLDSEAEYTRAYRAVEAAVGRRNDRQSQTGVHASIVIKRKGRPSPAEAT
jgi:hypothetical protein